MRLHCCEGYRNEAPSSASVCKGKLFATGLLAIPLDAAQEHTDEAAGLGLSSCFQKIKGTWSILPFLLHTPNKMWLQVITKPPFRQMYIVHWDYVDLDTVWDNSHER